MPDFVIQNPKDQKVYFMEVKFRASGEFKLKDLPKNYPYHNAYIILVSKAHIKCITVPGTPRRKGNNTLTQEII